MLLCSCRMVDILGLPCIQVDSYVSVVQRQDLVKANKAEQNVTVYRTEPNKSAVAQGS